MAIVWVHGGLWPPCTHTHGGYGVEVTRKFVALESRVRFPVAAHHFEASFIRVS